MQRARSVTCYFYQHDQTHASARMHAGKGRIGRDMHRHVEHNVKRGDARRMGLPADDLADVVVPTRVLGDVLTLSRQMIGKLVDDGYIERVGKDQFNLVQAVRGYIRFLRAARGEKSQADARVRDLRAQEIEVRTASRLGKLVAIEEFDEMITIMSGLFLSELAGMPARVTRDLALRRLIERDVHGIRERVANAAEELAVGLPEQRPLGVAVRNA
jgi:hypothetical protein